MPTNDFLPYISRHGILGQKWGVRRYQNADGSLTSAGQKRYGKHSKKWEKAAIKTNNAKSDYYNWQGLVENRSGHTGKNVLKTDRGAILADSAKKQQVEETQKALLDIEKKIVKDLGTNGLSSIKDKALQNKDYVDSMVKKYENKKTKYIWKDFAIYSGAHSDSGSKESLYKINDQKIKDTQAKLDLYSKKLKSFNY